MRSFERRLEKLDGLIDDVASGRLTDVRFVGQRLTGLDHRPSLTG